MFSIIANISDEICGRGIFGVLGANSDDDDNDDDDEGVAGNNKITKCQRKRDDGVMDNDRIRILFEFLSISTKSFELRSFLKNLKG